MADDTAKTGMSMFMMILMFILVVFVIWLIWSQFNRPKKIDIDINTPSGMRVLNGEDLKNTTFNESFAKSFERTAG